MNISIVGAGYVGLVTGACLAELGNHVVCVDNNMEKIAALREGIVPIYEPGLQELIERNVDAGRLSFSHEIASNVAGRDAVFLAVGTPPRDGDGEADLSQIFSAAEQIASHASDGLIIVTKSTVPVETGTQIERLVRRLRPDLSYAVVSNPEFLKEGSAISDFMQPDRVVIGAEQEWAGQKIAQLYEPLALKGAPIIRTSRNTAEVIKYASNAFLATKISFINEIADFCEATEADIADVADAMVSTGVSAVPSSMPAQDMAARAFRRIHAPCFRPPTVIPSIYGLSKAQLRSTRRESGPWENVSSAPSGRMLTENGSQFSGSPSSPIPTTCASLRLFPSLLPSNRPAPTSLPMIQREWMRPGA